MVHMSDNSDRNEKEQRTQEPELSCLEPNVQGTQHLIKTRQEHHHGLPLPTPIFNVGGSEDGQYYVAIFLQLLWLPYHSPRKNLFSRGS